MDIKSIDWSKYEEGGAVIRYLKKNWSRGLLTIAKFIGLSGMGKSYASIRCAELLAKEIHGEEYKITKKNIIKNLLGFIRFIREVENPGEIIIIEEMSVLFPSRRAMSGINVDANAIIDTVRKKGIIILGNYPLNKTIDSHIEAMCCLQVVVTQLNKRAGVCIAHPLWLQTNPAIPKTYYHKLVSKDGDEVDYVFFKTPSKELTEPYEEEKNKHMNNIYDLLERKELKRGEKIAKELGLLPQVKLNKRPSQKEMDAWNAVKIQGMTITEYGKKIGRAPSTIWALIKKYEAKSNITLASPAF